MRRPAALRFSLCVKACGISTVRTYHRSSAEKSDRNLYCGSMGSWDTHETGDCQSRDASPGTETPLYSAADFLLATRAMGARRRVAYRGSDIDASRIARWGLWRFVQNREFLIRYQTVRLEAEGVFWAAVATDRNASRYRHHRWHPAAQMWRRKHIDYRALSIACDHPLVDTSTGWKLARSKI